jgi:hypothetical protein
MSFLFVSAKPFGETYKEPGTGTKPLILLGTNSKLGSYHLELNMHRAVM